VQPVGGLVGDINGNLGAVADALETFVRGLDEQQETRAS